jgi:hypothetical protein
MDLKQEVERLKAALALTRQHNVKLAQENERLRVALGLPAQWPEPPQPSGPVVVRVHPELVPPPPRPPDPPSYQVNPGRARPRGRRLPLPFAGEKPLRTQWPLETPP